MEDWKAELYFAVHGSGYNRNLTREGIVFISTHDSHGATLAAVVWRAIIKPCPFAQIAIALLMMLEPFSVVIMEFASVCGDQGVTTVRTRQTGSIPVAAHGDTPL